MKGVKTVLGIIVVTAVIGALAGCPQPTDEPPVTYTVQYVAGGGTGSPPVSQTVNDGTVINLPNQGTMTVYGKTFKGWAAGGESYPVGSSYTVKSNVTFTAQWEDDEPGSDLFAGEWVGSIATPDYVNVYAEASFTDGAWTLAVGSGGPTVIGSGAYTYTGNSATLLGGSGVPFATAHIEAGVLLMEITGGAYNGSNGELTAYTPANQHTVTFDAQGGSASQSTITVNTGASVTNLPTATRSGYTFDGWYTQTNGGGSQFTDTTLVNGDMTVYAKWIVIQYTVTFDTQGGHANQSNIVVAAGGYIAYLPAVTKSGFTFVGWFTEINGEGSQFTASTTVNDNITVYAKWTNDHPMVTFDAQGGSASHSAITVNAGASITNLPTATRSGYALDGWFTQINGEGSQFTNTTPVNEDITVYACWIVVRYTVTFDAQGGSVSPSSITVNEGEYVTNLPTVTRGGYIFDGWFDYWGYQFTEYTPVNETMTVYAYWTESGVHLRDDGVYIGIISFAGDAADLTVPILLNSSGKNSLIDTINFQYGNSSQGGTALFYGVHRALDNLANITTYPDKLESVNVITFTDGLDNGSTGRSALNPIEDRTFNTEAEYASYVDGEIDGRIINGKPIIAYSVGVLGNDVTNIPLFQSNLEKIASDGKDYELTNFDALRETFEDIADELQVKHTNFNMKTTLLPSGTKVRMTFDVAGTGSADAAGSSKYLEGAITRTGTGANLSYTLGDITYGGGLGSLQGVGPITGAIDGSEVTFAFTGMEGYNQATDELTANQWTMTSGTTEWQINSEYSISGATEDVMRSAIIYLVLDASISLNSAQIVQIRSAATQFVNSLYDRLNN
jgi:uncharacterized repeat protein (TIGR02543 family)